MKIQTLKIRKTLQTYLWKLLTEYNVQSGIKSVLTDNLPISRSQNYPARAGQKWREKEEKISNL